MTCLAVLDTRSKELTIYENRKVVARYMTDEGTTSEDIEAARTYREDEAFDWVI